MVREPPTLHVLRVSTSTGAALSLFTATQLIMHILFLTQSHKELRSSNHSLHHEHPELRTATAGLVLIDDGPATRTNLDCSVFGPHPPTCIHSSPRNVNIEERSSGHGSFYNPYVHQNGHQTGNSNALELSYLSLTLAIQCLRCATLSYHGDE
jgi:hypothetical protein